MINNENELTNALEISQTKVKESLKSCQKSLSEKTLKEYNRLYSEQLNCERKLAEFRNEEYAIPIDFPVQWDTGAPLPFIISNENKTIATFYIKNVDPNWDGTYVNIRDPENDYLEKIALIEFKYTYSIKFGCPNDEIHEGHPLFGRGLDSYTAQKVINSTWIKDIENINSIHNQYNPKTWEELNHYVFWFHDTTLECIAKSFTVELYETSMKKLLLVINERLLK